MHSYTYLRSCLTACREEFMVVLTARRKETAIECPFSLTGSYCLERATLSDRLAVSRIHILGEYSFALVDVVALGPVPPSCRRLGLIAWDPRSETAPEVPLFVFGFPVR